MLRNVTKLQCEKTAMLCLLGTKVFQLCHTTTEGFIRRLPPQTPVSISCISQP